MSVIASPYPYKATVERLVRRLPLSGYNIIVSFEADHGDQAACCRWQNCECGLAVLLVYGSESRPVTLWVNGQQGQSWIDVAESHDLDMLDTLEAELAGLLKADLCQPGT